MKKINLFLSLLTVLVVLSLIFALADIKISALQFSIQRIFTFIGILVSSFALVIGVYFALLAVSAYSHIKNIRSTEERIQKVFNEFVVSQNSVETCILDYANNIYEEIDMQLSTDEYIYKLLPKDEAAINLIEERRDNLIQKRARLSYRYPMLNNNLRNKLILELAAVGDETDIEPLQKICSSNTEDESIKEVCRQIVSILLTRS